MLDVQARMVAGFVREKKVTTRKKGTYVQVKGDIRNKSWIAESHTNTIICHVASLLSPVKLQRRIFRPLEFLPRNGPRKIDHPARACLLA